MPLWISLKVALMATLITYGLGVPVAYRMAHLRGRVATLLDSVLLMPLVLPPTVIGFGLLWLLGDQGPMVWFPNIVFTWWAAVLTAVVVAFPLLYRTSRAAFSQIDPQLADVARSLGASEWTVFRRVALPLATPGIVAGTLLAFARALGEFGATLMLAGNIPGKTQTLPMAVYFAVESGDFAQATRWSLVIVAIASLTVALANYAAKANRLSHAHRKRSPRLRRYVSRVPSSFTNPFPRLPALEVDISKRLSDEFSLRVTVKNTEALLGILGESGAGKSLLLRCLAGLDTPDSGRIILGDRVLYDSIQGINVPICDRKIALLFQNYALFPHLTVAENVAFGIAYPSAKAKPRSKRKTTDRLKTLSVQQTVQQIVDKELAAVQMEDFAHCYPHQLSGGQQQRIALARALASTPQLLLLDEPFSALDSHLRSRLSRQLFSRLRTYPGTTLMVTHNPIEAYQANQLLVLHRGQTLQQDTPEGVFESPQTRAIAQLTGPCNFSSARPTDNLNQLYAHHWKMPLQLDPTRLLVKNTDPDAQAPLSVGIRPENVSLITLTMYKTYPSSSEGADKIAIQKSFLAESSAPSSRPSEASRSQVPLSEHNQALCWPITHWQAPHQVTVFLKLHQPTGNGATDHDLEAIVPKDIWQQLQQQPLPWTVYLPPQHIILFRP